MLFVEVSSFIISSPSPDHSASFGVGGESFRRPYCLNGCRAQSCPARRGTGWACWSFVAESRGTRDAPTSHPTLGFVFLPKVCASFRRFSALFHGNSAAIRAILGLFRLVLRPFLRPSLTPGIVVTYVIPRSYAEIMLLKN